MQLIARGCALRIAERIADRCGQIRREFVAEVPARRPQIFVEIAEGDRRIAPLAVQRIDEAIAHGIDRQVAIGPHIFELPLIGRFPLRIGIAAAQVEAQPLHQLELAHHLGVD